MSFTSFMRFSYPNLLLVFLTSLLGLQSSRGARKIQKAITNHSFIVTPINPDFEKKKKKRRRSESNHRQRDY